MMIQSFPILDFSLFLEKMTQDLRIFPNSPCELSAEELETHIVNNYVRIGDHIAIPVQWAQVFSKELLIDKISNILDVENRRGRTFFLTAGGVRTMHLSNEGKHLFIRTSLIADMDFTDMSVSEERGGIEDACTGISSTCCTCDQRDKANDCGAGDNNKIITNGNK